MKGVEDDVWGRGQPSIVIHAVTIMLTLISFSRDALVLGILRGSLPCHTECNRGTQTMGKPCSQAKKVFPLVWDRSESTVIKQSNWAMLDRRGVTLRGYGHGHGHIVHIVHILSCSNIIASCLNRYVRCSMICTYL